jgi:SAM-dependent methyltransferase
VAEPGIEAILAVIGPGARMLEVGAGTGRISIPLLERGVNLIGCDLSSKMLLRLREKYPAARLAQADAIQLPFPGAAFDAVLTAHVLHLIPTWRGALREFRRLLGPRGMFINLKTWEPVGNSIRQLVRTHWRDWLAGRGINAYPKGVQDSGELHQELQFMGAQVTDVDVIHYPMTYTLREDFERIGSRIGSDSWAIPDDIFNASLEHLRVWIFQEYSDLDKPRQDELRFAIDVARF